MYNPRPRKEKRLPTILSVAEVAWLINAGTMLKRRAIVHCLVPFEGLDEGRGRRCWPGRKARLVGHRKLCNTFRDNFLTARKN